MSGHTPGPWDDASKYPGVDSVRIFARDYYIATVGNSDGPRDVTEANARLIAAAPDLLAVAVALDEFQRTYEANAWDTMPGNQHYAGLLMAIVTSARAAIAKAEGRS